VEGWGIPIRSNRRVETFKKYACNKNLH
jgi:hypothetical protein